MNFAAKIDQDQPSGTYELALNFAATTRQITYDLTYHEGTTATSTVTNMPTPNPQTGAGNDPSVANITISSTTPTRTGYTFKGWCSVTATGSIPADTGAGIADCTNVSGTVYQPGATFTADPTIDNIEANLYALWEANTYNITFNGDTNVSSFTVGGESVAKGATKALTYGKPYLIVANFATGYEANTLQKTSGEGTLDGATFTPGAGTATITATSKAKTYNITFNGDSNITNFTVAGATVNKGASKTLTYGETYTITANFATGYEFNAMTKSSGSGTVSGTSFTVGAGTATLSVTSKAKTYNITFNGDSNITNFTVAGTTVNKGASKALTYGQTYTITINYATGYEFNSFTKSSGSGTLSGISFTVGAGVATLSATSKAKTYTINITNTNTTSGASSITVPYNGASTVTVTPTSGYYLSGVSCPSGYTCTGYNTGISYIGQQTITVTNNGTTSGGTLALTGTIAKIYMQQWAGCSTMNRGDTITLTDRRDNKDYLVGKLNDNNCWMLDNLRLDLTAVSLADLTATNGVSNTNADATALGYLKNGGGSSPNASTGVIAKTATGGSWTNSYVAPYIALSGTENGGWTYDTVASKKYGSGSGKIGIYYNYCAASAGSYCYPKTSSGSATQDICPAGWKMPNGMMAIGSYYYLYNTAVPSGTSTGGYGGNVANFQAALSTPLSGYFDSGSAIDQGSYGGFLSATRNSNTHMYGLYVDASSVNPQILTNRYAGFSVRCILK